MDNIVEKIINILNNLNLKDIHIENIETDFIKENNIDSITFIEIIIYIEEEFDILIPDEYLLSEKLNTIYKIANLVSELVLCTI